MELAARVAAALESGGALAQGPLGEVLPHLESAFAELRRRLTLGDERRRHVAASRMSLLRVEIESADFGSSDSAREALFCVRDDGEELSAVARQAGAHHSGGLHFAADLADDVRARCLSASPGETFVLPQGDGLYRVLRLRRKCEPDADDPTLSERVEQQMLEAALGAAREAPHRVASDRFSPSTGTDARGAPAAPIMTRNPTEATMATSAEGILEQVAFLQFLPAAMRDKVAARFRHERFGFGEVIVHEGDPADAFFILTSGRARVFKTGENGDEIPLNVLRAGDEFGEMALLQGRCAHGHGALEHRRDGTAAGRLRVPRPARRDSRPARLPRTEGPPPHAAQLPQPVHRAWARADSGVARAARISQRARCEGGHAGDPRGRRARADVHPRVGPRAGFPPSERQKREPGVFCAPATTSASSRCCAARRGRPRWRRSPRAGCTPWRRRPWPT